MPLLNGREVKHIPIPTDIDDDTKVFQIRFTGEVFATYQDYSARLELYRQPSFSCQYTGKKGMTFEQALDHESKIQQSIWNDIPSEYLPLILQSTQYSQLKLSDVVNAAYDACIEHYNQQHHQTNTGTHNKQEADTERVQSAQSNTNSSDNSKQNSDKTPPKKTVKYPFKKSLIRTLIRVASNRQNFKSAPWIVDEHIAKQYQINTEMPPQIKQLLEAQKKPKTKTKTKAKPKTKKEKTEKAAKVTKPESLISSLTIKESSKSLKYPCDDQLLLLFDKLSNEQILEYDAFWNAVQKIGVNVHQFDDAQLLQTNGTNNNYSNLAFIDFNATYDHNVSDETQESQQRRLLKHRQLNDMFTQIWKLWSFVRVFNEEMQMTPFPVSYLLDALCYDKRCTLLDEIHVSLLEIIRKHVISTIMQRVQRKREQKIKQIKARRKQQRANKRKQERREQQKQQRLQRKKKSGKEEADDDEQEEEDDDDEEEEEEEESEEEDSEATDSEEEESEEDEEEETEDDEEIEALLEQEPQEWAENSLFTDEPITSFDVRLLREYLEFRCTGTSVLDQMEVDDEEQEEEDDDDDTVSEVKSVNTNQDEDEEEEEEDDEGQPLLPEYEYRLSDEVWERLANVRSFVSLPIESKLEILRILFQDAMSTNVVRKLVQDRIKKYQEVKQQIKTLEDEHNKLVKTEKRKVRDIRNELIQKKKLLKPKKDAKSKKPKSKTAASSSSSSSSSAAGSRANSNSPNNKENTSSRSNSVKQSESSQTDNNNDNKAQQKALKLKQEVEKLEEALKRSRNVMADTLKRKEAMLIYKKQALLTQCRTSLVELGTDRFHNKYYWDYYTDGRIFVFHANAHYHDRQLQHVNDDATKSTMYSITKEVMKRSEYDRIKCFNEWETIQAEEAQSNAFCWSVVSSTSQFHRLLRMLDERGSRESELLSTLNALKPDIVATMKMVGNDDEAAKGNLNQQAMDVDDDEDSSAAHSRDDTSSTSTLRRSKRNIKKPTVEKSNKYRYVRVLPLYEQFANKGFLAYKNQIKRT